jgi:serine/threonine protein kinase
MTDDLIGKKFGGYEILDLIGRGGMATVYRAHQVSMNRVVALKVLPRHLLDDETYMQRFQREVAIVAQLEHRSIVPVHDYGSEEGQPYIVMRYMSGGSVDDLLREAGALDLERIVSIIQQIAPALDYAHSKQVLHRDLKPSNVLMDDDGGAFLTDFGIARLIGDTNVTLTTQGVVGTPSYMSPEQAQGTALDNRSDVYSLGVMLFEMATGRRPFEGDTPYGIAVKHVTTPPPPPRSINPRVPAAVEQVILKALNKRSQDRYPTAVALSEALRLAASPPASSLYDTQPGFPRPEYNAPPPAPVDPSSAYSMAQTTPPPPATGSQPVIEPPRSRLRRPRRGSRLWISAAVGVLLGCGLLTVLVVAALLVINATEQEERRLQQTLTREAEIAATNAPDDGAVLFSATDDGTHAPAPTLDPTSEAARATLLGGSTATTSAPVGERATPTLNTALREVSGTLIYFDERDGDFNVYRMNLQTRAEIQITFHRAADTFPAVSPDGTQIAFVSDRDGNDEIYVMEINGDNPRRLTDHAGADRLPSWSPDGEWIVFSSDRRDDGSFDLYRVRPDGSDLTLVFSDGLRNSGARWTPDGEALVFSNGDPLDAATWNLMRFDNSSGETTLLTLNRVKDWSPITIDGGDLLYLTEGEGHAAIARLTGADGAPEVIYDGPGYEWGAYPSPDGQHIAFSSDESGRDQIYLMAADGSNAQPITTEGGMYPVWISD